MHGNHCCCLIGRDLRKGDEQKALLKFLKLTALLVVRENLN